jgi:hypothetical protein
MSKHNVVMWWCVWREVRSVVLFFKGWIVLFYRFTFWCIRVPFLRPICATRRLLRPRTDLSPESLGCLVNLNMRLGYPWVPLKKAKGFVYIWESGPNTVQLEGIGNADWLLWMVIE